MVLVSSSPGENFGALGVVTLEDVIEELIGEEIIDESDVFIDVHKAIRRINPFPFTRRNVSHQGHPRMGDSAIAATAVAAAVAGIDNSEYINHGSANTTNAQNTNVPSSPLIVAVDSDVNGTQDGTRKTSLQIPADVMAHLKHLGPSNLASNPKKTTSKTIKIKHGSVDEGVMKPTTRLNRSDSTASNRSVRPGSRGYGALINADDTSAADEHPPLITLSDGTGDAQQSQHWEDHRHGGKQGGGGGGGPPETVAVLKRIARSGSLVEKQKTSGGVPKTVIETTSSEEEEGGQLEGEGGASDGKGKENSKGERSPLLWGR